MDSQEKLCECKASFAYMRNNESGIAFVELYTAMLVLALLLYRNPLWSRILPGVLLLYVNLLHKYLL